MSWSDVLNSLQNAESLAAAAAHPEVPINDNAILFSWVAVYGIDLTTTTGGLQWGYRGGRWGGFPITADTFTLDDDTDNYMVVERATGVPTCSDDDTNWNDDTDYARVYKITTASGAVTDAEDHRAGPGGIFFG